MTIFHFGWCALTGSSVGLLWLSELIKFVINIPPDYGYRDSDAGNNQVTKEIRMSVRSAKSPNVCCDCLGPFGIDGRNWEVSLGGSASPLAWIAGSILRLNQCGDTGFAGEEN